MPVADTSSYLSGTNQEAVIDALRLRLKRHRAGQSIEDRKTIGLVVEGGSLRGIYSAGGLHALAHLGYADLFDRIYATSAGAMNASYFLSHQPDLGISVYFESLLCRRFINPWRLWKILDIDWLMRQVISVDKPLDVQRVMQSRTALMIMVMDRRGKIHAIHAQRAKEPLLTLLKAAVAAPVLYNRSVSVNGKRCIDAGLVQPIPIEPAIADGCTDILVMTTRRPEFVRSIPSLWSRGLFNVLAARRDLVLRDIYKRAHERENKLRWGAFALADHDYPAHINIATFAPETEEIAAWKMSDSASLRAAAEAYASVVRRHFDIESVPLGLANESASLR
jgi:predicted patatin/cPLA2 family phospholipase